MEGWELGIELGWQVGISVGWQLGCEDGCKVGYRRRGMTSSDAGMAHMVHTRDSMNTTHH